MYAMVPTCRRSIFDYAVTYVRTCVLLYVEAPAEFSPPSLSRADVYCYTIKYSLHVIGRMDR